MIDTPAFATELAKFSLLTNVGRINTTMACKIPFYRLYRDDTIHLEPLSFSRNENGATNLSPRPVAPKD